MFQMPRGTVRLPEVGNQIPREAPLLVGNRLNPCNGSLLPIPFIPPPTLPRTLWLWVLLSCGGPGQARAPSPLGQKILSALPSLRAKVWGMVRTGDEMHWAEGERTGERLIKFRRRSLCLRWAVGARKTWALRAGELHGTSLARRGRRRRRRQGAPAPRRPLIGWRAGPLSAPGRRWNSLSIFGAPSRGSP